MVNYEWLIKNYGFFRLAKILDKKFVNLTYYFCFKNLFLALLILNE
jgi:hypothetical protein